MPDNKSNIALLLGDPAGIGPELISKLLNDEMTKKANIVIIGEKQVFESGNSITGISHNVDVVENFDEIDFNINDYVSYLGRNSLFQQNSKTTLMNMWRNPSLSIHGIQGAFSGSGSKTVVPASVTGKVSMRLVPNQDWKKVSRLFTEHIKNIAPKSVKVEGDMTYITTFDKIRDWAKERGLYDKGDTKTQFLKLMEEAGELSRAILKDDKAEFVDAIGDMVVVLTNLAHLGDTSIEDCIDSAYNVISKRKGKMVNGTFVKDN